MAGITVSFGSTNKRRNSLKVPPVGSSYQCLLKDETSIIKPVIMLKMDGFQNWNYCYIAEFNRYYYITDMVSFPARIWEIHCEVDVLATYSSEIKATPAFIMYSKSKYLPILGDSRLPITTSFSSEACATVAFPLYSEQGTYVTSVISKGGQGFAKVFAMSNSELGALANRLLEPDILETVKDYYLGQPAEAVVSCTWIPVGQGHIGQGSSEITAYQNELGVSGTLAIDTVDGEVTVPVPLTYVDPETGSWQDYRNFEPYTKYFMTLPGVGEIALPMVSLASQQDGGMTVNVKCKYSLSTVDGKITWMIGGNKPVMVVSGELGTCMPVYGTGKNVGAALGAIAAAAVTVGTTVTTGGALTPMAFKVGGQLAAGFGQAAQTTTGGSGGIGGKSAKDLNKQITVTKLVYMVSDPPNNVAEVIGRPFFGKATIGSCSGLVKCTGAMVQCKATEQEHNMLAQYVNCSENYIYGGIYVE